MQEGFSIDIEKPAVEHHLGDILVLWLMELSLISSSSML